jgi:PAS domain-containing protein
MASFFSIVPFDYGIDIIEHFPIFRVSNTMKLIKLANQFALFIIFFLLASSFLGFGGLALWLILIKQSFTALTYLAILLFFLCSILFWMATKDAIADQMGAGVKLAQRFIKKDEAYQEALSTQALYRHYFHAAPIGIIALDVQHSIEICNPMFCTLTEKNTAQCLQQPLYALFHKNDQDKLKAAITLVEQQGDPTLIEVQLATKKETKILALSSICSIFQRAKTSKNNLFNPKKCKLLGSLQVALPMISTISSPLLWAFVICCCNATQRVIPLSRILTIFTRILRVQQDSSANSLPFLASKN